MSEHTDKIDTLDSNVQSGNVAFKREEMIECRGCGRANPPNRFECLYCSHELDVAPDNKWIKFTGRKLEAWERGFNIILVNKIGAEQKIRHAAGLLQIDVEMLNEIATSGLPLPVARVESEKAAVVFCKHLEQCGFECSIVSDDDLAIDKQPIRLSGMDFTDGELVLLNFNTGEEIRFAWNDLALIVTGILKKGRVYSLEKKRRRGKTKLIDETATSSDEQIFDLYIRGDAIGFRVYQAGFDFSCLGDDKGLLAGENMQLLIAELKRRAPNTQYINSYKHARHLLDIVWETETRKDFHGLQRSGFGKVEFGSAVSTSNLTQFNKFSRLQFLLR